MITHRLINIRRANKILVFENGKLSSEGQHEELLKTNLTYKKLINNV